MTKEEPGFAVLTVTDNGTGIPKKEFGKIFSMYGRLYNNVEDKVWACT